MFTNKNILVTGGTGSIGSEIVRQLLPYKPKVIRILSNDEDSLFTLSQELNGDNLRFLVGDVRDKERVEKAVDNVDIVFHAAALKHVVLCEYNPFEAVKTNVIGTQNLIAASLEANVEKFIAISTDKAVNPTNVMGTTKLMAERLTTAVSYPYEFKRVVIFSSVRFGNVLHSRGSVVPLFLEQIKKGGPVTVTDPDMTRFVMSIKDAVKLVFKAFEIAEGGEIFVLKMPVLRIGDLAEVMIEQFAGHKYIPIKVIGRRRGEKNHEELLTKDESLYTRETKDMFIIYPTQQSDKVEFDYTSENKKLLTKEEIRKLVMSI